MGVRVGVDVGGTFTKAVALDGEARVVARAVVPTTHSHPDGVAAGVVEVVGIIATTLDASGQGAGSIELVTHSTTQAVNALLEGDVVPVGVLGMATAPHAGKARKRTALARIDLTDSRTLRTVHEFIDTTGGFDPDTARAAVGRLRAAGIGALCVAEAFAPDDTSNEAAVAAMAAEAGIPATTSTELSGLYGLELRTLTGALNASILPIALRTAEVVAAGVASVGVAAPVMVMRGDGGATDLAGFRRAPALTLYSGPAASVAGALRTGAIGDAVIVEVGGTSSNVAAIKGGRPVLAYVQVGRHSTAVRALDVRVAGVAGGSMLRARKRRGPGVRGAPPARVYGVGPRSAHIAGLPYACFGKADDYAGAEAVTIAPRPGDPDDYLVLRLADGRHIALTNTCAANALGLVEEGDYAAGDRAAAVAAFEVAGRSLRLAGEEVARRMITATTDLLGDLVTAVAAQHQLTAPKLVAVGGGAGGVGRALARALGLLCVVPPGAEVISSVGDALSLVRVERERTFASDEEADVAALVAAVEAEAIAAGAAPATLDVQVHQMPSKGAVRVVATGAVALASGLVPGRAPVGPDEAAEAAQAAGFRTPERVGSYWLARHGAGGRVLLLDRFADVVLDVKGEAATVPADAPSGAALVEGLVAGQVRHMGPITLSPTVWLVAGHRLTELSEAEQAHPGRHLPTGGQAVVIVGRAT
ncbi:MAG: N-methylhydantoinase [Actinomycetota bacterium]|nr:N-methylhydantoinase [Actinomycetota bacterium]